MNDSLTQLQKRLLEMFSWFHNFCIDNKIKYYALGGTMLGAIRHKGFIPWDDDIDVGIPRNDYEKLRKISSNVNNNKFKFEFPTTIDEKFATPYAKLYDITTTLIENYKKPLKRGIFIDIFPLDGTGNDEKESKKNFKKIKRGYNFFMTRVAAINKNRSFLKNSAIIVSRIIPNCFLSNRKLRIRIDNFSKIDFDNSYYGGNVFGNWGYKEIMPISIMGTPKEYFFENIKIYGVENYDEYLTRLYGNWKKLPPKEKQISHHDFIELNLEKSYLDN